MKYAVEYTLASGTVGLMIFSAADEAAAEEYVRQMITVHGHTHVSIPFHLPLMSL